MTTLLPTEASTIMDLNNVSVYFGSKRAVSNVSFGVERNKVTSLIGPSGSGKTTLLRSLNRLHDLTPGARVEGEITLEGHSIYDRSLSMEVLRSRIGMIFQRPNPFPVMSIYDNTVAGLRFIGIKKKDILNEYAEKSLRAAALWDAVKDRLHQPAVTLSGGEQQRLCIARALAVEPEILLMDEPTASLDPVATDAIEKLMAELKSQVTIVVVTHNMQQANRVSDNCAFLLMDDDFAGELIEFDTTHKIFNDPKDPRTVDYIQGRFG